MMPQIETVSVRTVRAVHWQGEELVINPDERCVMRLGHVLHLPEMPWRLFKALSRQPSFLPQDRLFFAIWGGAEEEPEGVAGTLKVMVATLRRKLAPLGIAIISQYGTGYRLELRAGPVTDFGYRSNVIRGYRAGSH
jgi:DNA-binding response OmpR family regulator